jgi:hypothetical protein
VPQEPVARLWHAATLLREHRGDGHVAALVAADIDGNEAIALRVAVDRAGSKPASWQREQMQPARGWTDAEWDAADARLTDRGLLGPDGSATAAGAELHRQVEHATDLAAARPWARLGAGAVDELTRLLRPIADACASALPFPNPVGLPARAGQAS